MHWNPRQFDEYLYVLGSKVCTCLHSQDAFSRRERKEEMYPTLVNLLTLVWVTCQSNFHIFFRVGFWYALPLSLWEHREGAVDTQQGRVASWRQQGRQEDWLCGNLRTFREDKVRVLPWDRLTPATPQQGGELCKNVAWAQVDGCDHPLFPQGLLHHNIYWCFRTGVPQNRGQEAMIKCSKFTVGYQYGWGFAILSLIIRIEISESTVGIQSLPPSHLPPRYFSSVLGSRMTTLKKRRYSSKKLL